MNCLNAVTSKRLKWIAFAALALNLQGCSAWTDAFHAGSESLMTIGMTVSGTTANGKLRIEATGPTTRRYSWDGQSHEINLWRRTSRWGGSLGLYSPGESSEETPKTPRIVADEGKLSFASKEAALSQLNEEPGFGWVSNSQGYVLGFAKVSEAYSVNIKFWRIYINGAPAKDLPMNDDMALKVRP